MIMFLFSFLTSISNFLFLKMVKRKNRDLDVSVDGMTSNKCNSSLKSFQGAKNGWSLLKVWRKKFVRKFYFLLLAFFRNFNLLLFHHDSCPKKQASIFIKHRQKKTFLDFGAVGR